MDQITHEQLNYARIFLNFKVLPVGPNIWNAQPNATYPIRVDVNGKFYDGESVADSCVRWTQNGDYASAVGAYVQLLSGCLTECGKIPVFLMRRFFKTLIAANDFRFAYSVVATVLADIQNIPNADPAEIFAFTTCFEECVSTFIDVIDNDNFSSIVNYCKLKSGNPNYQMVNDNSTVYQDIYSIRNDFRQHYGY